MFFGGGGLWCFWVLEPDEVGGEILGPVRVAEEIFIEELGHERRNESVNFYKRSLSNFIWQLPEAQRQYFEFML
jgi:hypothetical protein